LEAAKTAAGDCFVTYDDLRGRISTVSTESGAPAAPDGRAHPDGGDPRRLRDVLDMRVQLFVAPAGMAL
jgi:hypothetical protein